MANELVARHGLRVSGSTYIQTVNTDETLTSILALAGTEVKQMSLATFSSDFVTGGSLTDNTIFLEQYDGTSLDLGTVVAFTGFTQTGNDVEFVGSNVSGDTFEINAITGATFSLSTGTITWAGSNSYATSLVLGTDFVTGVTESDNVFTITKNGGASVSYTADAVTDISYDSDWAIAYSGTGVVGSSPVELPFITGGTYSSGSITLGINGGLESEIVITGLTSTDTHVTGGTLTQSTGQIELTFNQEYGPVTLDNAFTFITGGTLSNNEITLTTNTGLTYDLGTVNAVTGGTFDASTGTITLLGTGALSDIELGTAFITGVTEANNVITVGTAGAGTTDYTIDAVTGITYDDDWAIAYSGTGDLGTSPVELPFITAASYSGGEISFTVNGGLETIDNITGLTFSTSDGSNSSTYDLGGQIVFASSGGSVNIVDNGSGTLNFEVSDYPDDYITGGTYTASTGTLELHYKDNAYPSVEIKTWDYITGGSVSSNVVTLTSNLGTTYTAGTVNAATGGTFDASTGTITLSGSGSLTDIELGTNFITGVTELNNVITVGTAGSGTTDYTIDAATGGTYNASTGIITLSGTGTLDTIDLGTDFITGVTESDNVFTFTNNGGVEVSYTADAVTDISYSSDWAVAYSGTGVLGSSPVELPFITGASFDSGTITLGINGGLETDITVDISSIDTYVTGATVSYKEATLELNNSASNVVIDSEQTIRVDKTVTGNSTLELFKVSTDSYTAVHVEYHIKDEGRSGFRSGFFTAAFDGSSVTYSDWSTTDSGTMSTIEFSATANGEVNVTQSGGSGNVRVIANTRAIAL